MFKLAPPRRRPSRTWLLHKGLEVAAGVKQTMQAEAKRIPGMRPLEGRFMAINQAMGRRSRTDEIGRSTALGV